MQHTVYRHIYSIYADIHIYRQTYIGTAYVQTYIYVHYIHAYILVGKYLTHLGLQHKNLQPCRPSGIPLSETTIADELGALGYKSHLIGN